MAELGDVLELLVARVGADDDGELLEEVIVDVAVVDLEVDAGVQLGELDPRGIRAVLADVGLAQIELQRSEMMQGRKIPVRE